MTRKPNALYSGETSVRLPPKTLLLLSGQPDENARAYRNRTRGYCANRPGRRCKHPNQEMKTHSAPKGKGEICYERRIR